MFNRLMTCSVNNSFFLFGARSTGKSTFLEKKFRKKRTLWIDLLNTNLQDRLAKDPEILKSMIEAEAIVDWVVIDEIQKIPQLLDVVHSLIKNKKAKFALTGSSARKLKRGGANLLAGRAFNFVCHPLTHIEIDKKFNLGEVLRFGSLPEIFSLPTNDKINFLRSYVDNYFKEEVVAEQLVRKLRPFRNFLQVAAQMNGKILNISRIAGDVGVDHLTIQNYFEILEDTLVGFQLEPYHQSIRKRQRKNSKFYYFDLGVTRALLKNTELPLVGGTYDFGNAFEHFIVLEIKRLRDYLKPDWEIFYLKTKDDAEIDLIIDRPGMTKVAIEIKSTDRIDPKRLPDLRAFKGLANDLGGCDKFVLSNDSVEQKHDDIWFLPWKKGIQQIGF